uniref:Uncharacterized protein n=1 Tax=Papilio xuthus TaxID=66420 RepID=I4DQL2_PAPXU|nr:unknown unsecreted protein [Papilio xuthus]
MKIQSYNLDIEYTPGKVNVVDDALSRPVDASVEVTEEAESCSICPVIRVENQEDIRKAAGDQRRRDNLKYKEGDLVLVETHRASNAAKGFTNKFVPRREGPHQVSQVVSPTTFVVVDSTGAIRGKYHASALTPYVGELTAIEHARRRGRLAKSPPGRASDLGGEVIAPRRHHATSRTVRAPPPSRHSARLRARRSSPVHLVSREP